MLERDANKKYRLELFAAMVVYIAVLAASIRFARPMPEGTLRTLLLASPMIPIGIAIWVIARHFARIDEFMRLRALENLGIAAAVTAGWTFSYGFLETAGFPRLTMFTVWGSIGFVWMLATWLRCRQTTP